MHFTKRNTHIPSLRPTEPGTARGARCSPVNGTYTCLSPFHRKGLRTAHFLGVRSGQGHCSPLTTGAQGDTSAGLPGPSGPAGTAAGCQLTSPVRASRRQGAGREHRLHTHQARLTQTGRSRAPRGDAVCSPWAQGQVRNTAAKACKVAATAQPMAARDSAFPAADAAEKGPA